ncbi:MAG: hypothetical protein HC884_01510 [Chloroflexaceae bacterium]|nr:hypothetical protein [Chloroflexaceae bacterium]
MAHTRYLMWFDDNPKIPTRTKIEEAIAAYQRRFKTRPNVVLVSEGENGLLSSNTETLEHHGVLVRGVSFVRRNNFWVGLEKDHGPKPAPTASVQ